jgi:hypothetical protein
LVCWHLGARQCDLKFIQDQIKEIEEDPDARWIYMGDGGECVTKLSKGKVWEQTLPPQTQLDLLIRLLEPIADKGILGVRGNHGNRIDKETGISFDKSAMTALRVPYGGVAALGALVVNRTMYGVFCHHGVDGGVSLQAKYNASQKFRNVLADVKLTAHSHVGQHLPPYVYEYLNTNEGRVESRLCHQVICGSAYDSRVEGYAREKGYEPLIPARVVVRLDGTINTGHIRRKVDIQVINSTGDYDTEAETTKRLEKLL